MLSNAVRELQVVKKQLVAKIIKIDQAIKALAGLSVGAAPVAGKRKRTPAQRKTMAKAQKARWAKIKAGGKTPTKPTKKRKMSAAARAKIAAFQKARWAKIKAAKK